MKETKNNVYSTLFTTIYDENSPVGNLGRGSHYSILRAAQFLNQLYEPQTPIKIQDFCVVWDEDHDTRVIDVIESLYTDNLLAPVLFIGERKGGVTVIVDKKFYDDSALRYRFDRQLRDIVQSLDDPWGWSLGYFDKETSDVFSSPLINDSDKKVDVYLLNINNLWRLGLKEFKS
jgi:hypothetical protein